MHLSTRTLIILCTLCEQISSVPLEPRLVSLQPSHDQLVESPVAIVASVVDARKRGTYPARRRSINYSVVQVDGSSTGAATVVQTVTVPAPTTTVLVTATTSAPQETVTTTLQIAQTPDQRIVTTTISNPDLPETRTQNVVSTCTESISTTITASPTHSTSYYDDGLWHTYYPVKDFQPPWTSSTISTSASTTSFTSTYTTVVYPRSIASVEERNDLRLQVRKAPADLQIESWDITES